MGETLGALDSNPGNVNMVAPQGFKFQIKKLPDVNFFMQTVDIPDITLPTVIRSTPFVDVPIPGDHLTYGDLTITFKLDEDLNNYRQLNAWMTGLGFPDNPKQYGDLMRQPRSSGLGIYSDASILATTNLKNPNIEFLFQDCWPSYIGGFKYDTKAEDIPYLTCMAQFKYTLFTVSLLT